MNFSKKHSINFIFLIIIAIGLYSLFKRPVVEGLSGAWLNWTLLVLNRYRRERNGDLTTSNPYYKRYMGLLKWLYNDNQSGVGPQKDSTDLTTRIRAILNQPENKLVEINEMITQIKNQRMKSGTASNVPLAL
jgi:hypothetical protein